jgi:glycosyltransferase involved in cell wall biosynthesis
LTEFDFAYESYGVEEMMSNLANQADFAVLNDIGPALASYLRCPYASVLTGSDLTYYADFRSVELRTAAWDPGFRRSAYARRLMRQFIDMAARQRDGILMSHVVCYAERGLIPEADVSLDTIGVTDKQRLMIHLSDVLRISQHPMPGNRELKIFCGSRVVWKQNAAQSYSAQDMKGTDILIDGFALYCRQGGMGTLWLPRKGSDLEDAVLRIAKLGIESRVTWYENMSLQQFEQQLISADLVCDQFGSSFPGMVTTQAYALGRPVMANFRREVMPFDLPGLHVVTPEDVCDALIFAEKNRFKIKKLGEESRCYAERHLSPKTMATNLLKRTGLA